MSNELIDEICGPNDNGKDCELTPYSSEEYEKISQESNKEKQDG